MPRQSSEMMLSVYRELVKAFDSDLAGRLERLFSRRDAGFLDVQVDPLNYTSADVFRGDYLLVEFLSKWKGLAEWGIFNPEAKAVDSWRAAEDRCLNTNRYFRRCRVAGFSTPAAERILVYAQRKIAAVLGVLDVDRVLSWCKWGPGATATLRSGAACTQSQKHSILPMSCSFRAAPYFMRLLETDPNWIEALTGMKPEGEASIYGPAVLEIIEHNRVIMVPKNAKTHRTIAAEPTANSFLQQGVGRFIRRRLKRFGVDLDDQAINQTMAKYAVDWGLATIDFSMASDLISRELVHYLLPVDWALFLDDLRSVYGDLPPCLGSEKHRYEKFSSMGNAFTFELETLIFWSLALACCEECQVHPVVSVYGDDVILPSAAAQTFIEIMNECGLIVNTKKSFLTGPFRESCGKHYFNGVDVTPFYQKDELKTPVDIARLANRVIRFASYEGYLDDRLKATHDLIVKYYVQSMPGRPLPRVPLGLQLDDGLICTHEAFYGGVKTRVNGHGYLEVRLPYFRVKDAERRSVQAAKLALWLREHDGKPSRHQSTVRWEIQAALDSEWETIRGRTKISVGYRWVVPPREFSAVIW